MGKGKFVKTRITRRKCLRTFELLPYGILKLYKMEDKYMIVTQDFCPRCDLKIMKGSETRKFLQDMKQVFKDVEQAARDLKIMEENDAKDANNEDSAPTRVSASAIKRDDFNELEDLNKII